MLADAKNDKQECKLTQQQKKIHRNITAVCLKAGTVKMRNKKDEDVIIKGKNKADAIHIKEAADKKLRRIRFSELINYS